MMKGQRRKYNLARQWRHVNFTLNKTFCILNIQRMPLAWTKTSKKNLPKY